MSSSSLAIPRPDPTPRRWKHGAMPVIGLTGGIGSGKSRVADLLKGRGACVIDADAVGHEVLEVPDVRDLVVARFGPQVLRPASRPGEEKDRVDRRLLGSIVFADPEALRDLERIVHPRMCLEFEQRIARESERGVEPMLVLDAAILLETGWDRVCDLVVFVDASFPVRLDRVSHTRGWTLEDLKSREAAQWPVDRKRDRADVVLRNESGLEALELEVDAFFRSLAARDPGTPFARADSGRPVGLDPVSHPWETATSRPRLALGPQS
jgi:dephospho-CoA kinase